MLRIILLDIDHFKLINDTYGHQAGDQVLIAVAGNLRANIRQTDIIGRWGGEEFMILCPGTDLGGVMTLAENLRHHLAATPMPPARQVTASFGVASYGDGDQPQDMACRPCRPGTLCRQARRPQPGRRLARRYVRRNKPAPYKLSLSVTNTFAAAARPAGFG